MLITTFLATNYIIFLSKIYIYKFYHAQDIISLQSTTEKFNKSTIYSKSCKNQQLEFIFVYNLKHFSA